MMVEFTNMCATLIQKHIRRRLKEKEYRKMLLKKRKVAALVRGFKTRRVLQGQGQLKALILECREPRERRQLVRELIQAINTEPF